MIDPKKILRYIADNFDEIKTLYKLQKEKNSLSYEEVEAVFATDYKFNALFEYAILEEKIDETFMFRELYFNLIEGLLDDYSLDMPEQISKYHTSLSQLSVRLKSTTSKNEINDVIRGLVDDINKFDSQLKRNVKKLIDETKYIKANNDKLEYTQKVKKASELSSRYLEPLNVIMQNHSDSIVYLIETVQLDANINRFTHQDINLRGQYEKLSSTFARVKREIQNHNRLLINEVVPLLERIHNESKILTGFINFLSNPNLYAVPEVMQKSSSITYSTEARWEARDIWDSVHETKEDIVIENTSLIENTWLFDNKKYTTLLHKCLPIDNFYSWIKNVLVDENDTVDSRKFLALSKLIFNQNIEVFYFPIKIDIELEDKIINAPIITIKRRQI